MTWSGLRRFTCVAALAILAACTSPPDSPIGPSSSAPTPSTGGSPPLGVPPELAGARVVFAREDGIFQAATDGTHEELLFDHDGWFEYQPDWSPNGRWLAVRVDDKAAGGTVLISSDGQSVEYITRDVGIVGGSADWAPDSRHLVLTGRSDSDRTFGLYVIDIVQRAAVRITPQRYEAQYPAWSPNGRRIVFTRVDPPTNTFDLWTINPNGTRPTRLTRAPEAENYAAWSPDGTKLAYYSEANDSIWGMDANGTHARAITRGGEPQWEPGDYIIFDCLLEPDSPGQSCVVRPDGTGLTRLPLGDEAVFPNWVPVRPA